MYTPVNTSFTIQKWGLRGLKLYRHVSVMLNFILKKKSVKNNLALHMFWMIYRQTCAESKGILVLHTYY